MLLGSSWCGYGCVDDSLDVFAVHGIGGCGSLLVAYLALPAFGGLALPTALRRAIYSTAICGRYHRGLDLYCHNPCAALVGLRVDQQDEIEGLDLSQHGERGYHSN